MARDVGTERIPVSGRTKDEPDFEDGIACYQVKCRKVIPSWLWGWLTGIQGTARRQSKAGVLVLKRPNQRDEHGLVVLSWQDWVSLHGSPHGSPKSCVRCGERILPGRDVGDECESCWAQG